MMGRFVAADSPAMDALVADAIAKIGAEIDAMRATGLAGVVLGGGYGRGEGGVLVDEAGETSTSSPLPRLAPPRSGCARWRRRLRRCRRTGPDGWGSTLTSWCGPRGGFGTTRIG